MNKPAAIFLDRDGVINRERGDYTYKIGDFELLPGVTEAIKLMHEAGFKIIVITNQAGIAKGIYTVDEMKACHEKMQQSCNHLIDAIYYAPGHPSFSESLLRKPDSLMFEKAIAKYSIDPANSWMIGDKERDLIPARKLGINTILIGDNSSAYADYISDDLFTACKLILELAHLS